MNMRDKIIYYSKTGNTESVAKKLSQKSGIPIEKIVATSDDPNQMVATIVFAPSVKDVSFVIIGSPVHGFSLPKVTKAYLESLGDLTGKTFDLFVTHYFPFAGLGGKQTLNAMKKIILSKNGQVNEVISINWTSRKREKAIAALIQTLSL